MRLQYFRDSNNIHIINDNNLNIVGYGNNFNEAKELFLSVYNDELKVNDSAKDIDILNELSRLEIADKLKQEC
jgi:hypothetical protein